MWMRKQLVIQLQRSTELNLLENIVCIVMGRIAYCQQTCVTCLSPGRMKYHVLHVCDPNCYLQGKEITVMHTCTKAESVDHSLKQTALRSLMHVLM